MSEAHIVQQGKQWINTGTGGFLVPYSVAEPRERLSDELLLVAPGLMTSPQMAHDAALEFARLTGQRTCAYRPEYGRITSPMRQVPDRAGLVAETLLDAQTCGRAAVVAQSAGGIILGSLLERSGRVSRGVFDNTVGLSVRSQLHLSAEAQEEADQLPLDQRGEFLYGVDGGEDRMRALLKGLRQSSLSELGGMALDRDGRPLLLSVVGGFQDIVPNLAFSWIFRNGLPRTKLSEALRLGANIDLVPEIKRGREKDGTRIGVTHGRNDRISPLEFVEQTLGLPDVEVDDFDVFEGPGHPYMTSKRARESNLRVVKQLERLGQEAQAA